MSVPKKDKREFLKILDRIDTDEDWDASESYAIYLQSGGGRKGSISVTLTKKKGKLYVIMEGAVRLVVSGTTPEDVFRKLTTGQWAPLGEQLIPGLVEAQYGKQPVPPWERRAKAVMTMKDWAFQLRRMTKIYNSVDDVNSFLEAKRLFENFRNSWEDWEKEVLPPKKSMYEAPGGQNLRKAIFDFGSAILPSTLFPTAWDYKTDTHEPAPWELKRIRKTKTRAYQTFFRQVVKDFETYQEAAQRYIPEMGEAVPEESFEAHGLKFVVEPHRDTPEWRDWPDQIKKLGDVTNLVKRAGFGAALKDLVVRIGKKPGGAGMYTPSKDELNLEPNLLWDGVTVSTLIHELGHRFYFRNIPSRAQREWEDRLKDQELEEDFVLTDYSKEHPHEAYAEAFINYIVKGPRSMGPGILDLFKRISLGGSARLAKDQSREAVRQALLMSQAKIAALTKRRFLGLLRNYGPHVGRSRLPWNTVISLVMQRWEMWNSDDFDSREDYLDWQYLYNAAYALGWGLERGRFSGEMEKKIQDMTPAVLLKFIASVAPKATNIDAGKQEISKRLKQARLKYKDPWSYADDLGRFLRSEKYFGKRAPKSQINQGIMTLLGLAEIKGFKPGSESHLTPDEMKEMVRLYGLGVVPMY